MVNIAVTFLTENKIKFGNETGMFLAIYTDNANDSFECVITTGKIYLNLQIMLHYFTGHPPVGMLVWVCSLSLLASYVTLMIVKLFTAYTQYGFWGGCAYIV